MQYKKILLKTYAEGREKGGEKSYWLISLLLIIENQHRETRGPEKDPRVTNSTVLICRTKTRTFLNT